MAVARCPIPTCAQHALLAADIIVCTPEKWDGISRNWQSRSYVRKVGLSSFSRITISSRPEQLKICRDACLHAPKLAFLGILGHSCHPPCSTVPTGFPPQHRPLYG